MPLYTVGHSNAGSARLLEMLTEHGVQTLVDIRTIPRSRRNPWAGIEELPATLAEHGIDYEHRAELGGLRRTSAGSINDAWENLSFRGFADYMQTQEFLRAADRLALDSREGLLCIMCAESVPWRCHRGLVADALTARGVEVLHLMAPGKTQPHALTKFAKVDATRVWYPATARQTTLDV